MVKTYENIDYDKERIRSSELHKNKLLEVLERKKVIAGLIIILILVIVFLMRRFIMPYNPNVGELSQSLKAPSLSHIFGTDDQGRDIFSRIIDGAGISLKIGIVSVAISLTAGTVLGALAGFYGGITDMVIMRIMDIMLAFPSILLAIAFMSTLGKGVNNAIIAISIVGIPQYARIVKGSVLSVKENEYIEAAKMVGNSSTAIIFKHILPNILSPIIVKAALGISSAILDTSGLGFLGLGVQPPQAEWGSMLGSGRQYIYNAPYVILFPGIFITVTVIAFNLLGDGLRDALDPKFRK